MFEKANDEPEANPRYPPSMRALCMSQMEYPMAFSPFVPCRHLSSYGFSILYPCTSVPLFTTVWAFFPL